MTFLDPRADPIEVSLCQGNNLGVHEEVLSFPIESFAVAKSIVRVIPDRFQQVSGQLFHRHFVIGIDRFCFGHEKHASELQALDMLR